MVLVLLFGVATPLQAQTKKQLEKDKARVEQEIKNLNSQLSKTKKNSSNNQRQLKLLEEKIAQRTRLINNIDGQLNQLTVQMSLTEDSIALVRSQVDSLKAEYAHVVRTLYGERGSLDRMVLLFDTRCEGMGGSGRRFDWSLLDTYEGETPFLLSGGIGPGDATRVRQLHHPRLAGIDLNSRFETSPGVKDIDTLRKFIDEIRSL